MEPCCAALSLLALKLKGDFIHALRRRTLFGRLEMTVGVPLHAMDVRSNRTLIKNSSLAFPMRYEFSGGKTQKVNVTFSALALISAEAAFKRSSKAKYGDLQ